MLAKQKASEMKEIYIRASGLLNQSLNRHIPYDSFRCLLHQRGVLDSAYCHAEGNGDRSYVPPILETKLQMATSDCLLRDSTCSRIS